MMPFYRAALVTSRRFPGMGARVLSSSTLDSLETFRERLELLDLESAASVHQEAPVTTVTFFEGATRQQAHDALKTRLRAVVQANPWLAGRVIKHPNHKRLMLAYPCHKTVCTDQILDRILVPTEGLELDSKMPYAEMSATISGSNAMLPKLSASYIWSSEVNDPSLVTRAGIVRHPSDEKQFALVLSMSHVAADGHSYYSVLNQLSEGSEVTALSPVRKHESTAKTIEAQGKDDYEFMFNRLVPRSILGMFNQSSNVFCLTVDRAKMKAAKAAAVAQENNPDGVEFVSSNDVLCSAFANLVSLRICLYALSCMGICVSIGMCSQLLAISPHLPRSMFSCRY